jgi:hypothetical protein
VGPPVPASGSESQHPDDYYCLYHVDFQHHGGSSSV